MNILQLMVVSILLNGIYVFLFDDWLLGLMQLVTSVAAILMTVRAIERAR